MVERSENLPLLATGCMYTVTSMGVGHWIFQIAPPGVQPLGVVTHLYFCASRLAAGRGKSSGSAVRDANAARDRADMERVTMHTGPRPRQRCRFVPVNFRKQAATDGSYGYKYW